jgi:phosphate-selective porin OprO/OprP
MSLTGKGGRFMNVLGGGALLLTCATSAMAQSRAVAPSVDAPEDVQAKPAQPAEEEKKKPAKAPKKVFNWQHHPSLQLGEGTHIDFRARVQENITQSAGSADTADPTAVDWARRRIGVEGEIANAVEFQIERELGSDTPWRDLFVGYKQFVGIRVQAGKFKLPFSLDENTGATNLDFVNRSLAATHLAPGRDRGVMVHGRVLRRAVTYQAGIFDRDGDNARTRNPLRVYGGRTTAGRVVFEPFRTMKKSPLKNLAVGVAMTASDVPEGLPALKGRTVMDATFFGSDFPVNGQRRRTGFEARWSPGPFSVKSEYIRVLDERRGLSVENTDLSPLVATGWYVSGTWAVTGERKAAGLDSPARPLFRGGIGAVELAARVEALGFGSTATDGTPSSARRADVVLGNRDRAGTLGVNWYVNRWVKVQFNVVHERLADPAQGPRPAQPGFWSRGLRFQFSL